MSEKYPVGTKLQFKGTEFTGEVVENFKLPGDICVKWNDGNPATSYDAWYLDEHTTILPTNPLSAPESGVDE